MHPEVVVSMVDGEADIMYVGVLVWRSWFFLIGLFLAHQRLVSTQDYFIICSWDLRCELILLSCSASLKHCATSAETHSATSTQVSGLFYCAW